MFYRLPGPCWKKVNRKESVEEQMSFGHFDEVYAICCELSARANEKEEETPRERTNVKLETKLKPASFIQQELSEEQLEEQLYEKV